MNLTSCPEQFYDAHSRPDQHWISVVRLMVVLSNPYLSGERLCSPVIKDVSSALASNPAC